MSKLFFAESFPLFFRELPPRPKIPNLQQGYIITLLQLWISTTHGSPVPKISIVWQ